MINAKCSYFRKHSLVKLFVIIAKLFQIFKLNYNNKLLMNYNIDDLLFSIIYENFYILYIFYFIFFIYILIKKIYNNNVLFKYNKFIIFK